MDKVRVNLANPSELHEIPGIQNAQVEAILRFRAEHGPITDVDQLGAIVGRPLAAAARERLDFEPAAMTAPEAPGA